MINFEFATAGRIIFGAGKLKEIGAIAAGYGTRALIVTGRSNGRAEQLQRLLAKQNIDATIFNVVGEPSTATVEVGVKQAKMEQRELVIAIGGGSAIDAGKAIAGLLTNHRDLLEYLEIIGQGKPLEQPAAPFVALPTTAGTGAEVTRNAVLASPVHRVKASLRSPFLLPRVALVDPELTYELPPAMTASTGLDALTQLIEPYVSIRAHPFTDALCLEGIRRVTRSLSRAYADGGDKTAREDMCVGSLFGGLALANAGLGAVHGFAAPIGGMFTAPHGAVCAALLPHVMRVNLRALQKRQPLSDALGRYTEVARLLTGNPHADVDSGAEWVGGICRDLGVKRLRTYGIRTEDFAELSEKAATASSMKANPIPLTAEERLEILTAAW